MLRDGDRIPDVKLQDQQGHKFTLGDFLGRKVLVVFFYPADETPLCTKEACHFRDAYEDFVCCGAEVIGISSDTVASHRAFSAAHRLPFLLLSDSDGSARKAFGVGKTIGLLPGRVTFVVDKQGIVRLSFEAQFSARGHVQKALAMVRELVAEQQTS